MRQRLDQKRQEQEQIEKNQELLVESRRSTGAKVSMRSADGGEQRLPEKVILLTKGTKIPWRTISLSHGGFKASTLHEAAATLQTNGLGMLIFFLCLSQRIIQKDESITNTFFKENHHFN
jgi:hypothetical protein